MFIQKKFEAAASYVNSSSLKKDNKNQLLYLMEMGNIYYYQGKYKKAADIFVEANELVDKLYTKSIKAKIASTVINNTKDVFYASVYERSLLYYYQALSFYQLHAKGSYQREIKSKDGKPIFENYALTTVEKKRLQNQIRSTLMAWDSFFSDIQRMKGVKTFLKDDLISKIVAAKLHLYLGKRRDKEIALQLLKDARSILIKLGPSFKQFNASFKDYSLELRNLYDGEIKKKDLKSKKLTDTYQLSLNELDYKILALTKKMRKSSYKRLLRQLKPVASVIKKLKKIKRVNTTFLIEVGHITKLDGKDFSYNLRSALESIEDPTSKALINGIGIPVLTYFAMGPLGLGFVSHHGNVSVFSSHNAGTAMVKEVGIEFELPYVAEPKQINKFELQIMSGESVVATQELSLVSSLNDLAFLNAQELIENNFSKRAVRVGVKYALAIAAAYQTYKNIKESSSELFAKPAALAQFLISSKAIKESEKADARHWSTLPAHLITAELYLEPGEYQVKVIEKAASDSRVLRSVSLGQLTAKKETIFSHRLF